MRHSAVEWHTPGTKKPDLGCAPEIGSRHSGHLKASNISQGPAEECLPGWGTEEYSLGMSSQERRQLTSIQEAPILPYQNAHLLTHLKSVFSWVMVSSSDPPRNDLSLKPGASINLSAPSCGASCEGGSAAYGEAQETSVARLRSGAPLSPPCLFSPNHLPGPFCSIQDRRRKNSFAWERWYQVWKELTVMAERRP